MEYAISVKNLTKQYESFVLKNITFSLPNGCILGLIGENGAGKTTTIRLLLNMLKRDSGTISLLGLDNIQQEAAIKKQVGVVLDDCFFHESLNAKDVATIFSGIYPDWDNSLFDALIKKFNLPVKKAVKELSRGMKQKLNIAAALGHRPKLLILDEATSGLDPVIRDEILDMLRDFIQDETHSVLLSSHITSDLEKIADYIAFLHKGQLLFYEEKDDLLFRHGVLQCSHQDVAKLNPQIIIGRHNSAFGVELLVNDREQAHRTLPQAPIQGATLEDIMLFEVKKEANYEGINR